MIHSTIKAFAHQDRYICEKWHCCWTVMANAAADLAISGLMVLGVDSWTASSFRKLQVDIILSERRQAP